MFNTDGTWKRNESYTAILELAEKLKENNIPYELIEFMDGWQIIFPEDGLERVGDCVEHFGSYGKEQNLLEVYGFGLKEPDGWLTVEQAFEYFKKASDNRV